MKNSISKLLYLVVITLSLASLFSCVPSNNTRKKTTAASTDKSERTPVPTVTFSPQISYFQINAQKYYAAVSLQSDFDQGMYLRGKNISDYIQAENKSNMICLLARFKNSTENKLFIFAGSPKSYYDPSAKTMEYYYYIDPANEQTNRSNCQQSSILSKLSLTYPGERIAYSLETICSTCTSDYLQSESIMPYTNEGLEIEDDLSIFGLSVTLKPKTVNSSPLGQACSSSQECKNLGGYDCCLQGQCVVDRNLRDDVDTSSQDYLQAINDIATTPEHFKLYPQFYYICPVEIYPTPTPAPTADPGEAARIFKEKEELYNCTTPIEGEMSICTISYSKVETSSTAPVSFSTNVDDRNFNSTYSGTLQGTSTGQLSTRSLVDIMYGDTIIFEHGDLLTVANSYTIHAGNDSLTDAQSVTIYKTIAGKNSQNELKMHYKIDGSCEKISDNVAKCYKEYVQGQNLGKVNDHYPGTNDFAIPYYADTTKSIVVEVNGVRKYSTSWSIVASSTNYVVRFSGTGQQVYDTQTIRITFYVNSSLYDVTKSKLEAINRIDELCNCGGPLCTLTPVYTNSIVTDYKCKYPTSDEEEPPLQQKVYVSPKSVPMRYFNQDTGAGHETISGGTPAQEGKAFKYFNNNKLLPNNVFKQLGTSSFQFSNTTDTYIGFNEIYGSMGAAATNAKPPTVVKVKKGKTYDILTESGEFSSCLECGVDYYTNLHLIFPRTFNSTGGGYRPDPNATDRFAQDKWRYRSDDLVFGRACFIPATMLPWSHYSRTTVQQQRLGRLASQHFLFANGYNRDWYGFDYGALIGSFDGVTWFAIGLTRRIEAKSNRLYLAVNTYFGDQSDNSTYNVLITDTLIYYGSSGNIDESTVVSTNSASSGAECQKYHECETDKDCVTKLGWDYTCQSVSGIKSSWPTFDTNGDEMLNSESTQYLRQILGATEISGKRCVYRGRGSPCHTTANQTAENSYTKTTNIGLHGCNSGYYCQSFSTSGNSYFNDRIARYAETPHNQNKSSYIPDTENEDTFGLAAKLIGRPLHYNGTKSIPSDSYTNLGNNKVTALCLPGRDPSVSTTTLAAQNSRRPASTYLGDKVLSIGMTLAGTTALGHYVSSCSILDENGNFYIHQADYQNNGLANSSFLKQARNQALPTNALGIFESLSFNDIIDDFDSTDLITTPMLQANRCLRAANSPCFSDFDCGPNSYIYAKVVGIDPSVGGNGELNEYEIKFWQEGLICSQADDPPTSTAITTDSDYDLKNNRCCREKGKILTIGTSITNTTSANVVSTSTGEIDFSNKDIPASTINLSDERRYSRTATYADKLASDLNNIGTDELGVLFSAGPNQCDTTVTNGCYENTKIDNQFKIIDTIATRTCCSGNWIRNFNQDNGGGHHWKPNKMQNINKKSFQCLNWRKCTIDTTTPDNSTCASATSFDCSHVDDPEDAKCLAVEASEYEYNKVFEWLHSLELTGIPQLYIKDRNSDDLVCKVDVNDQTKNGSTTIIGDNVDGDFILQSGATSEIKDDDSNTYLTSNDSTNFGSDIKQVFSKDEFTCCVPAGKKMDKDESVGSCCSGFINDSDKCCLEDYTNLSVYYNRYVSSGAKDIESSLIDGKGDLEPETVEALAKEQNPCCSGSMGRGIVISAMGIKGHENVDYTINRYVDGNDEANNHNGYADLYDAGRRWNNDVYCIPANSDSKNETTVGGGSGSVSL